MFRSEDLKSSIKKYLDKLIRESEMDFNDIQLPIDELLEPTSGRTPPNSFMLYCKDHASVIKNSPGNNSKYLSQMWDNENPQIKRIYSSLSDVMALAYKEVFGDIKPWENSALMPAFCLNQNISYQDSENIEAQNIQKSTEFQPDEYQDTQRTQENTESESQPFIDKSSAHYLSYYNF
jgi:hypothetical protein